MRFLPLIWAGLWRKPARTLLTLLSIVIAFLLFGLLQGVDSAFSLVVKRQKLDRMFVDPRFGQPVPIAYKAQIERLKGIKHITEVSFMPATYQDPKNGMLTIFTIPARWLAIRPEFEVPKAQVDAAMRVRTGVIISDWLAKHNGWKIGDRITVNGVRPKKDGSLNWQFDVLGIMHNPEATGELRMMLANHEYFTQTHAGGGEFVNRFLLRTEDPTRSAQVAKQIDALFVNSPVPTRTQNEQDSASTAIARLGDISFFTKAIMSAVFFALMFLTLNTTMESVRERTAELATLKTLGFSDVRVLALVLAESVVLFVFAAALGLAAAAATFPLARTIVGTAVLPAPVLAIGAVVAIGIALISAMIPAWRAKRLNIVQALAVR